MTTLVNLQNKLSDCMLQGQGPDTHCNDKINSFLAKHLPAQTDAL